MDGGLLTKILASTADQLVRTLSSIIHSLSCSTSDPADCLAGALCGSSKCTLDISTRSSADCICASLLQIAHSTLRRTANVLAGLAHGRSGRLASIASSLGGALCRLADLLGHGRALAASRLVEFA